MFSKADLPTLFANRLALSSSAAQHSMVDLHGLSESQAQRTITDTVEKAHLYGWKEIYFITGRGNHVNAKGQRGTLYKKFSEWINEVNDHIAEVKPFLGYYEVKIKDSIPVPDPFEAFLNEEIKDFLTKNFQKIKKSVETKKDPDDMLALAICHDNGYGTKINKSAATKIYLELGNDPNVGSHILYEIACRYFVGTGIQQNDALAIQFYTRSANQHFVLAAATLGNIYLKGTGIAKPDYILAHRYFTIAAEAGHAESARKLGYLFNKGLGVTENLDTAISYWEQAEQLNDPVAAFNLAGVYQTKRKNPEKFAYYLKRSADLGDPDGQFCLGLQYFFGFDGVKPNREMGLKWITEAANNFNHHAQYFLFMLALSNGNKELAKQKLMDAAKNSHIEAQALVVLSAFDFDPKFKAEITTELFKHEEDSFIGMPDKALRNRLLKYLITDDSLTKAQMKKVIKMLGMLAKQDYPYAYALLGALYINGKAPHIPPNPAQAYANWLAGSKVNDVDCLASLGLYWRRGAGGKVDFKKAITYLENSIAINNNAYAHNELGLIYQADAAGELKDIKLAAEHFRKACELDASNQKQPDNIYHFAARNLAILYLNGGENFPSNEQKAIELFSLAAEAGSVGSATFLIKYYFDKNTYDGEKGYHFANIAADLGDEKATVLLKRYHEMTTNPAARAAAIAQAEESEIPNSALVTALAKISELPFQSLRDEKGHVDAYVEFTAENLTKVNAFYAYLHGKGEFRKTNKGHTFFVLPNVDQMQNDFHQHLKDKIKSVNKNPSKR